MIADEKFNADKLTITAQDTPEKFLPIMDELVPMFVNFLRNLCALEEKMFAMDASPESDEYYKKYRENYGDTARQFCTEKLLARGYAVSYGDPAKYSYLNTGCELIYTMKSPKRAVIVSQYEYGVLIKRKFVLKNTEDGWKLDSVSYCFGNDEKWHTDTI